MFNNTTTTFGSGAGAVVPTTVFPGTTITSNSTFIIIGSPPPFPAPPRSIDLSPLKLIFAVIAIVAVPALAYALFFTVPCSSSRRSRSSSSSDDVTMDIPPPMITAETTTAAAPESGEKFQKEKHSKEVGNECTVCLSVFTDGDEIRRLSACKHAFHVACVEEWLKDHPNCPICRAYVPVKQQTTEAAANVTVNVNRSGGNRRVSATNRDEDWRQGLPDASTLV